MKKRIAVTLLTVCIITSIGCGTNNGNVSNSAGDKQVTTEQTEASKLTSLDSVCAELKQQGLLFGETTVPYSDMIGAVSGIKYPDSNAEIYEFDTSSDVYKNMVKSNKVYITSMNNYEIQVSAINGKYALMLTESNDALVEAFKNLK